LSAKDPQLDKSAFSLQNEIKKRKTQEIQRTIESRKVAEARGEIPASSDPRRSTQTIRVVSDSSRATQTAKAVPSIPDKSRSSQTTQITKYSFDSWSLSQTIDLNSRANRSMRDANYPTTGSRRSLMIGLGAGILAALVLVSSLVLAGSSNAHAVPPTPTLVPLPLVSASDVSGYLKRNGVPILEMRELPVDRTIWYANQEVQFDVQRGENKGTFIFLSYPSDKWAVGDSLEAESLQKFKGWQVNAISNVLILTSPDAAPDIQSEMSSHLTSYLLSPYRSYLPTPTPEPPKATATQ